MPALRVSGLLHDRSCPSARGSKLLSVGHCPTSGFGNVTARHLFDSKDRESSQTWHTGSAGKVRILVVYRRRQRL